MPAYTEEEARDHFLQACKDIALYWANESRSSREEACEGVVFSILNIFDGCSGSMPAMNIHLCPHPDDKQFHIDNEENYYEPNMMINDCTLHEVFIKL